MPQQIIRNIMHAHIHTYIHTYIYTHIHTHTFMMQEDNLDQTLRTLAEKSHTCDKTVAAISQQLQDVMEEHNARYVLMCACVCVCVCVSVCVWI